jgi:HrpA-like RNA helicase
VEPGIAAQLLAAAWLSREPPDRDRQLLDRLAFAGIAVDRAALARTAAARVTRVDEIDLQSALPRETLIAVDRLAPEELRVPSGRSIALHYAPDGVVTASVKLQELFGLADTPRLGPNRTPVRFALLAPNGRPVQLTSDLRSFWERTYAEVRKELRGRYPKHPWPEDPWTAMPTARTTRKAK